MNDKNVGIIIAIAFLSVLILYLTLDYVGPHNVIKPEVKNFTVKCGLVTKSFYCQKAESYVGTLFNCKGSVVNTCDKASAVKVTGQFFSNGKLLRESSDHVEPKVLGKDEIGTFELATTTYSGNYKLFYSED